MASTIKLKNGSGAPLAGDLVQAEPALDLTNKRLYTENASGTVIEVGTNPSSLTIGGTALTATAAELNTLDGITATTAELNTLDGITATVTELNYTDGVTSNIQTQLNTKAPIASPTFTGTVTAPAVNVNGTVTADGLTVDSDTILLDSASSAFMKIDRGNNTSFGITRYYTAGTEDWRLGTLNDGTSNFYLQDSGNAERFKVGTNGDISFYEDTGTTAKFFWDASAEYLGVGTTSPATKIHAAGSLTNEYIAVQNTNATGGSSRLKLYNTSDANQNGFQIINNGDDGNVNILNYKNSALAFWTNTSERMRIDASGNVGIGTTSPAFALDVDAVSAEFAARFTGTTTGYIRVNNDTGYADLGSTGNNMLLRTGGVERVRIDSSGNLLVGKSGADTLNTVGAEIQSDGQVKLASDGKYPLQLNRLTSDGVIVDFRKDGTTIGSIGGTGSTLDIGSGDTNLRFNPSLDNIYPVTAVGGGARDGAVDLGVGVSRFKDLYLSGGVYLGGTGAANLLDDYEEGTWTPVIEGLTTAGTATYTVQEGNYTKVGRMVTVTCNLAWSGHTGTGSMLLSGLPFNAFNDADRRSTASAHYNAFTVGSGKELGMLLSSSTSKLSMYANDPAGGSNVTLSVVASCGYLAITMTYQAA